MPVSFFPPPLHAHTLGLDLRLPLKAPFIATNDHMTYFHAASDKVTSFHSASENVTPFHASLQKVTPFNTSEATSFHTASEKVTPFHTSDKVTPFHTSDKVTPFHTSDKVTPFHSSDKVTPFHTATDKLSGLISPFPTLPHPLTFLQQLRHHHSLVMSERLVPNVILPKTSPFLQVMSSIPAVPAPTVLESFLSSCRQELTTRGLGEERLMETVGVTSGFSPQMMSESANTAGMSLYGRKVFPCAQCRYTTDRRNNLKRHLLTMHQLSAKLLECCGMLFRTKAAMREHALVFHYHGYSCFFCGRRFCRKALLKRHLSVHNGQKEFLCNVCDYATSHKSNLERHRRVHGRQDEDDLTSGRHSGDLAHHLDQGSSPCDDVKSNGSETNSHVDCASFDDLSVCSDEDDEEEEIIVHGD